MLDGMLKVILSLCPQKNAISDNVDVGIRYELLPYTLSAAPAVRYENSTILLSKTAVNRARGNMQRKI